MIDPEQMQAAEEQEEAEQPHSADADNDKGPLESIDTQAAENGVVVTHHPRASERVKNMDAMQPKKHVFESHKKALAHIAKHIHRLKM